MKKLLAAFCLAAVAALASVPVASAAEFGLSEFDVTFSGPEGETVTQAGSHPFAVTTKLRLNTEPSPGGEVPVESTKDLRVTLPPGLVGDQGAVPQCSALDFLIIREPVKPGGFGTPSCADSTAIGIAYVDAGTTGGHGIFPAPLYNLEPPPGKVARFGFIVESVPVTVDVVVSEKPPYNLIAIASNVSQALEVFGAELTVWGVPADDAHDEERGRCFEGGISCPSGTTPRPFITLPRSCTGPLETIYELDSWQKPGLFVRGKALSHEGPNPIGMIGCGKLGFSPVANAQPSVKEAESASGLEFTIDVRDEKLTNPNAEAADADIEAVETILPPGVTLNPSAAEGLEACSEPQFKAASLTSRGCPEAAKVGTLEADTPLLEGHTLHGSIYVARQDENPFGSLLALYLFIRDPELGIFVKLPAEVETDEKTGRLVTRVGDMPPFPLGHVGVHLRSGPRAPLVTPPTCGTYMTTTILWPSSGRAPLSSPSSFTIDSGPDGAPCPPGAPPFDPHFEAGSVNNAAGAFSPFLMRMTRSGGEQEITRLSAALPAGVVPKLAGVPKCGEAEIEAARTRSGRDELAGSSCPPGSQIGTVVGGAGVGSALTYVEGKVYLAGPFKGDRLSAVAVVPAVAGPFDLGTVVTRVALRLNPTTYRGEIDSSASDPIPSILKGIPLKLRDLRINVDRQNFTLNPTNCREQATAASIFGNSTSPFDPADDISVERSSRYQAASCASLAFKPKLSISFKGGGTKRSGHPALHSVITYPKGSGHANIGRAAVILPPSEFIDQDHISNPCTRPQFAAGNCPRGSVLGTAKATTPLLDEPLRGLVYFRSNGGERKLPDIVIDLQGLVRVTLIGQVDTKVTKKGVARLRTTFPSTPDAPISSFTLDLKGGEEGLLVNNRNLCARPLRFESKLAGQNGRRYNTRPRLKVKGCRKQAR